MRSETLKKQIISFYELLIKQDQEAAGKVRAILGNPDLSPDGKERKIEAVRADLWEYLIRANAEIDEWGQEIIKKIDNDETYQLEKKTNNVEYASLLANTVAILPMAVDLCEVDVLKERLSVFENDPVAIAAIKTALSVKYTDKDAKPGRISDDYGRSFYNSFFIPEDNRGMRQEHLRMVLDSVSKYINTVNESIKGSQKSGGFSNTAVLEGAISFLERCNDDCTAHKDGDGIFRSDIAGYSFQQKDHLNGDIRF